MNAENKSNSNLSSERRRFLKTLGKSALLTAAAIYTVQLKGFGAPPGGGVSEEPAAGAADGSGVIVGQ